MSGAADTLYALVCGQLWDLLARYRSQAEAALAALSPAPEFNGTPLEGRVLQPLVPGAFAGNDPALASLAAALARLLPQAGGGGTNVAWHGFAPGNGQSRGPALVLTTAAPSASLVVALTGDGPNGVALEIASTGAAAVGPAELALGSGWAITLSAGGSDGGRLLFPRAAAPQFIPGTPALSLALRLHYDGPALTLGPAAGPHLTVPAAAFEVTLAEAGGMPHAGYGLSLPGAQLALAADALAVLLGDSLDLPIDLDLAADPLLGLVFKGAGVHLTLPAALDLPGIQLHALELGMAVDGADLRFEAGLDFNGGLPGLPLEFTVQGLGASFPVSLGSAALGLDPAAVRPVLPQGLGVDLALPVLAGGGALIRTADGGWGGVLDLDLVVVTVQAFGLLNLPANGRPLSFAAILSVQFPLPGIQLSFGFSLNAVGGVVAVNRRLDAGALFAAVCDGSADQLLFPVDPAAHAPAIVSTLGHVFPEAEGHVVIGPMLQIAWGGRVLSLALAAVIDLPDPVQLTILARLSLALPDPAVPLVLIQATIQGSFEFSPVPTTLLGGSLAGSNIVGIPLSGDLLFMLRGGDDPVFVLSVGGFHPRYRPPAGVPATLHRVSLDLTPPGFPGLRSETYFAVTSNSVQLGAHLELNDEIAGCGVDGWFDVDVLFLWDPSFSFSAHASAGVAVQVLGETLMGVSFDLVIDGPAPWHVHGSGSVDLFLFSASLDFDVSWGRAQPALTGLPTPPGLGPILAAALGDPTAWIAAPPNGETARVSLSREASSAAQAGHRVHPLGGVTLRQRAVPLGLRVQRYQNLPITPQTWRIVSAALAEGVPAGLGTPTQDEFPPGEFLDLSEDQKLGLPSFEPFTSGISLTPAQVLPTDPAALRPVDTDFETWLFPNISLGVPGGQNARFVSGAAESLLTTFDPAALQALWTLPGGAPVVSVLGAQPLAAASTQTMQSVAGIETAGYFETLQALQAQFGAVGAHAAVQVVERWEIAA